MLDLVNYSIEMVSFSYCELQVSHIKHNSSNRSFSLWQQSNSRKFPRLERRFNELSFISNVVKEASSLYMIKRVLFLMRFR